MGGYQADFELDDYHTIREALANPNLSRALDRRTFAEGNSGDGTVSVAHGSLHRSRRKIENTQFRKDVLLEYERNLFPPTLNDICDQLLSRRRLDLVPVAPLLSVSLAAQRAGLDYDHNSVVELQQLVDHVDAYTHGLGPNIVGQEDPRTAHARVLAALSAFEQDFVVPSWERRARLLERSREDDGVEPPMDILTVLLQHREEPELELQDDSRIVREVATYLQGGTHSSAQTTMQTLHYLFGLEGEQPAIREKVLTDPLYAQRCVHETLRLRPLGTRLKRIAEEDTVINGQSIPRGSILFLDIGVANRDSEVFGPDADGFNPDRRLERGTPRWGLSFSFGAHTCPGRSSAVGLNVQEDFLERPDHLFGTVTVLLRELVRRDIRPDPVEVPVRVGQGERPNDWLRFPVVFPGSDECSQ